MKILLLSCDTGCGHTSAAQAVAEALDRRGIENQLVDPLSLGGNRAGKIASSVYTTILRRAPGLFGALYRIGDIYSSSKLPSPIYYANSLYADRLLDFIEENSFDRVVCTHLFPMEAVTALKKRGKCDIPCFGVLTDYTCIPFFEDTRLDGYFIPHEDLRREIVARGLPDSRIFSTGIPVSRCFALRRKRSAVRSFLSIPEDEEMLLVMSGGVGCGDIIGLCGEIVERGAGRNFRAYILTGHNSDMREELERRFGSSGKIVALPFTKHVNILMNAADVMISKPGGLSSTEAAVARIPLVQQLTYAACEAKNLEFFASHGMALKAEDTGSAVEKAFGLIDDPSASAQMRERQRLNIAPDAADRIADIILTEF